MILNQWSSPTCGNFALVAILQHMWVQYDWESILYVSAPYIPKLEKLFIEHGLIEKFVWLLTPRLVDIWLKKWEYLLTATFRWDFTLNDNKDWVIEFDEHSQHYFCIVEDCWDKWKCQNSWGKDWNWDWYFYMKKSDFKYLLAPRRVIIKKNPS